MPIPHHVAHRRSLGEVIAEWWRDWRRNVARARSVEGWSERDVERLERDVGLPAYELQRLANHGCHAADLLLCRMAALDLNPQEVEQIDRAAFLDLERVCSNCGCKGRCTRDLARRPDDAVWEDYCPNVATLKMLNAMPWASRREW